MILFLATRAGGRRTCGMIMTYDLFCFRGGDARYAAYLKSRSNGAVAHWVKVQEWTACEKEEAQALKHILFSTGPIPPPEGEQHRDGRRKRTNTDQAAWVGRRKRTDTNQDARAKPSAEGSARVQEAWVQCSHDIHTAETQELLCRPMGQGRADSAAPLPMYLSCPGSAYGIITHRYKSHLCKL